MKKVLLFLIPILLTCQLTGCSLLINPKIDYGNSNVYSKEEMDYSIKLIKKEFFNSFMGSELKNIRYVSDDKCGVDELEWLNVLAEDNGSSEHFTECMLFLSDFQTTKNGRGDLEADYEYTDWQWWLARSENGKWKLVTNGWG